MYAVIQTGGKQYRVQEGDVLRIEKLAGEAGSTVEFDQVLLMGEGAQVEVGAPFLDGRKVTGKVRSQGRGAKVEIVKLRRRKHYRKTQGHRQAYTEVEITSVSASPEKKAAAAPGTEPSGTESKAAGKSTPTAGGGRSKTTSSGSAKRAAAPKSAASTKRGAKSDGESSPSAGSASASTRKGGKGSSADGEAKAKSKDS